MAYKKITKYGEEFIKYTINRNSSILSGHKEMVGVEFDRYDDVFGNDFDTSDNTYWRMRSPITLEKYSNDIIKWYNKYGEIYELDTNVLAAQTYQESLYRIWDFSSSTKKVNDKNIRYFPAALGLTQFIPASIDGFNYDLTQDEKNKLYYGISNEYLKSNSRDKYSSRNKTARLNIPILLQNLIDNPEIAIKLQFTYMKKCSSLANGLASSALIGYNRGHGVIKSTSYTDTINYIINNYGDEYLKEGVDYVFKIFAILGDKNNRTKTDKPKGYWFGYDELDMNHPPEEQALLFNPFEADTHNTWDGKDDEFKPIDFNERYK